MTTYTDYPTADLVLEYHGSIWLVALISGAAQKWWEENVAEGPMWTNRPVVEHRYIDAIATGAREAGLVVRP